MPSRHTSINARIHLSCQPTQEAQADNVILWLGYFVLRQLTSGEFKPSDAMTIIKGIDWMLILVVDWAEVTVVTRLWCNFELISFVQLQQVEAIQPRAAPKLQLHAFVK